MQQEVLTPPPEKKPAKTVAFALALVMIFPQIALFLPEWHYGK